MDHLPETLFTCDIISDSVFLILPSLGIHISVLFMLPSLGNMFQMHAETSQVGRTCFATKPDQGSGMTVFVCVGGGGMGGWMGGWVDGWVGRWVGGWMGGWGDG